MGASGGSIWGTMKVRAARAFLLAGNIPGEALKII
jgi:hypothetical protein